MVDPVYNVKRTCRKPQAEAPFHIAIALDVVFLLSALHSNPAPRHNDKKQQQCDLNIHTALEPSPNLSTLNPARSRSSTSQDTFPH